MKPRRMATNSSDDPSCSQFHEYYFAFVPFGGGRIASVRGLGPKKARGTLQSVGRQIASAAE